ncbi:unnamed protein product [Urochloa decumbens]|uniref:BHLH domain-containing protein n=1 Tax=Urochloa decumbens TaxID=240449 RepID=A0ABC9DSE9_9POAL
MALLEAVVFPPDHPRVVPCCSSCGTSRFLAGYGVAAASAGEFEGIIEKGVVVVAQEDGESVPPPHGGACCAWAGGAATSTWAGAVPSTTLATSSAPRPAVRHQQAAAARNNLRRRRGAVAAKAARRGAAEAESLRQSHIAVERGRRRRVNEYLAALRALMPPSYSRRGDQASIVGGAIEFVKELEHHLQSLQAQKRAAAGSNRFPGFFTSPQYSATTAANDVDDGGAGEGLPETRAGVADVEAAVSEGGHATVKVLAPRHRRRRMLLGLLIGMQRRGLAALHLNATTTADQMVLYTFTLKMGDEWQLSPAGDVAAAVHDIVACMDTAEERVV